MRSRSRHSHQATSAGSDSLEEIEAEEIVALISDGLNLDCQKPMQLLASPAELFVCVSMPAVILAIFTSLAFQLATKRMMMVWCFMSLFAVVWFFAVAFGLLQLFAYEERQHEAQVFLEPQRLCNREKQDIDDSSSIAETQQTDETE